MSAPEKHYTGSTFVLTDSQPAKTLLLLHRKHNVWLQPGGHQETWENPLEAAVRETREETGLDVAGTIPLPKRLDGHVEQLPLPTYLLEEAIPAHGDQPAHYHLDMIYVVRVPESALTHNTRESDDIGWFTAAQLDDLPMLENTRLLLKQELAK